MKIGNGSKTANADFGDNYKDNIRQGPLGAYIERPPIAQRPPDFEHLFGDEPKPDIKDYRDIDNFNPDYAEDSDVAKALGELAKYNHDNLMADTPELRDKLANLANALDITPRAALENYQKVKDYMVLAGRLPEQPLPTSSYLAARNAVASGKVLDHYIEDGLHPAYAALISRTIGRTGAGDWSLNLSDKTFDINPDDGFLTRAAKTIGNFFTGAIGDHSVIHDTLGMLYTDHRVGPGYTYAKGAIPPAGNYTTGQVSGTLQSFGRKAVDGLKSLGQGVSDLASQAFGAVKTGIKSAIGYLGLDKPRTHQEFGSILEQRDKAMFGKRGQTLSEFREQQARSAQSLKDMASGAIDSVKDFGRSVVDGAKDIGRSIKDTVSGAFNSISDALGFGGDEDKGKTSKSNQNGGGSDKDSGGNPNAGKNTSSGGAGLPDSF